MWTSSQNSVLLLLLSGFPVDANTFSVLPSVKALKTLHYSQHLLFCFILFETRKKKKGKEKNDDSITTKHPAIQKRFVNYWPRGFVVLRSAFEVRCCVIGLRVVLPITQTVADRNTSGQLKNTFTFYESSAVDFTGARTMRVNGPKLSSAIIVKYYLHTPTPHTCTHTPHLHPHPTLVQWNVH